MYEGLFYLSELKTVIRNMDYWSVKNARFQAKAKPFTAELHFNEVKTTVNGYVYFTFKDYETGIVYPVFKRDIATFMQKLTSGSVEGTFAFRKIGTQVGIYLVADTKPIELVDRYILGAA